MKKAKKFIRDVSFTTAMSFLLVTFLFIGLTAVFDDSAAQFERYVFMKYMFGKLCCIFLFSLSLGFINRIFDVEKLSGLAKRVIRFFLASIAFLLFMCLMFSSIYEGTDSLNFKNVVANYVVFVVCDFVVCGVCALFRNIFREKGDSSYKPTFEK